MVTIDDILNGALEDHCYDTRYVDWEAMAAEHGFARLSEWEGPQEWRVYAKQKKEGYKGAGRNFIAIRDCGRARRELVYGGLNDQISLEHDLRVIEELRSLSGPKKALLRLGIGRGDYVFSEDAHLREPRWAYASLGHLLGGEEHQERKEREMRENVPGFAQGVALDLELFSSGELGEQELRSKYGEGFCQALETYRG